MPLLLQVLLCLFSFTLDLFLLSWLPSENDSESSVWDPRQNTVFRH